jgi:2-polyprenyl-3-methyl-5-hydroxy-6-metoxy-1,4-benzoquinol methylase
MAAICRSLASIGGILPKLVAAFRSGDGVAVEAVDAIEAQGDFNRPWLVRSLASEYLPQVPDVHAKLRAGARVADVACGVGWAAISIARGYPATTVDGFDLDAPSIERAQVLAKDAGVADRVTFQARDAADPTLQGEYDLAVVVEAVHDMSHPVEVLATIHRLLAPGGTLIVADERVADAFHAPANETERLFYGYSVLDCLPAGMVDQPSAGTGTVMRRSTLERYASEAGFSRVSVLPIEHDFLRFYRLDP